MRRLTCCGTQAATRAVRSGLLGIACVAVLTACGSSASSPTGSSAAAGSSSASATPGPASTPAAASTSAASAPAAASPAAALDELPAAERVGAAEFPPARGRSLTALARLARLSLQLGPATGTYTLGQQRFAFALTTKSNAFVYAPTAVYVASSPTSPARGPFAAPADPMTVAPRFRSRQNAGPGGLQAIYAATVPVARAGLTYVLALTRTASGWAGAPGELAATARSPIPGVGQRPPDIATDTLASVHGDRSLLTTRIPPEQMATVSLRNVLGRRPVALLFSTPQLCMSRVCGPVTDLTVSLQHRFGRAITFIHEEVYVDNNPKKGLRPQMTAFGLRTEPWLFAINRRGIIAARLEGSFGIHELTAALQAALH